MSATTDAVLNADQLNDTDEQLLAVLQRGRATPTFAADEADVSREYASERLKRMTEHGNVEKVAPGLYELRYDPRKDADDDVGEQRELKRSIEALKADRDGLQQQIDQRNEIIERLQDNARQARIHLDEAESAAERGDGAALQAALDRGGSLLEVGDERRGQWAN